MRGVVGGVDKWKMECVEIGEGKTVDAKPWGVVKRLWRPKEGVGRIDVAHPREVRLSTLPVNWALRRPWSDGWLFRAMSRGAVGLYVSPINPKKYPRASVASAVCRHGKQKVGGQLQLEKPEKVWSRHCPGRQDKKGSPAPPAG